MRHFKGKEENPVIILVVISLSLNHNSFILSLSISDGGKPAFLVLDLQTQVQPLQ